MRVDDYGGGGGTRPAPKPAPKPSLITNVGKSIFSNVNKATSPKKPTYSAPRRTNSGGGGGGGGYRPSYPAPRPSSGSSSTGSIAPTVKAPPIPTQNAYLLGDTAYIQQQNAFKKALDDYALQYKNELTNYNTEYGATMDKLKTEKGLGATNLQDDYASRGLLTSGVYADALNKFNQDYTTKFDDLARAKSAYETDLSNAQGNFKTEQQLLLDKAKQDALNRYADKYK